MDSTPGSTVPLPPLFPTTGSAYHHSAGVHPHHPHHTNNGVYAPLAAIANPQNLLRASGQLSWLSPKAGLIQCQAPLKATVSFQLKDFCDSLVTDLTTVLRVGFQLSFHAVATSDVGESNNWIANFVAPITDADLASANPGANVQPGTGEINLEEIEQNVPSASRQSHKDPYSLQMEYTSIGFLLSVFQKSGVHFVSLSSLHSKISNSGREELYRYIGSSSLKRRQFIERRSYIFCIADNDMVYLQPAEIYSAVCLLSSYLLKHGGVTSSDALFSYFNTNDTIPQATKDSIQKNRHNFMAFLARHPFVFSPFPSQFYVSARRNLPYFDYPNFIKKNFPSCVFPRNNCVHGPLVGGGAAPIGPLMAQRPNLFGPFGVDPTQQHGTQPAVGAGSIPPTPITPMPPMTPLFPELSLVSGGGGGGDPGGPHGPHPLAMTQPPAQTPSGAPPRMMPPTPVSSAAAAANIWSPPGDFPSLGLFDHHPRQDSLSSLFPTNGHTGGGGSGVFAPLAGNPRSTTDLVRRQSELNPFYLPAGSNPSSPIPPLMSTNNGIGISMIGGLNGRRATAASMAAVVPTTESATQTDQSLVWATGVEKKCSCKCTCGVRSANDSAMGATLTTTGPSTPTLFSFETASRVQPQERSQPMHSSSASPPNYLGQNGEVGGEAERPFDRFDPFARVMPFDLNQLNQLHLN